MFAQHISGKYYKALLHTCIGLYRDDTLHCEWEFLNYIIIIIIIILHNGQYNNYLY